MAATEPRPCPGCESAESRTVGEVGAFPMRSCLWCGTLFTVRLPTSEESKDYGRYYHAGNLEVPPFVRGRLEDLVSSFDADRRLNRWLDVRCGAGTLMQARGRGWEVTGTEVAERRPRRCARRGSMSEAANSSS